MSQETANSSVPELPPPQSWSEAADRSHELLEAEGYRYQDPQTGDTFTGSHWIDHSDRTHRLDTTEYGYVFRTYEYSGSAGEDPHMSMEVYFGADGQIQELEQDEPYEFATIEPEERAADALARFGSALEEAPGTPRYEARAEQAVRSIFDTIQAIGQVDGKDVMADPMFHAEATIPTGTGRDEGSDSVRHRYDTITSLDTNGLIMYAPSYSQVQYRPDQSAGQEQYRPLRSWTLVAGSMVEHQDHLAKTDWISPDPAHLEDMAARLQDMLQQMQLERAQQEMV